ncbi:hypothetical protein [Corynebacterium humireducens]|uniref:hypothetical protein n=1 Tax=Corynebacterium humireducens TaxID=1223514 RepID=UPI000693ACEE|nr:hypothetical protein [Corynebacterium humireducens]
MTTVDYLRTVDLTVGEDQTGGPWTFTTGPGLTLLHTARENYATALSLTLAGRRKARGGSVHLGEATAPRDLFPRVALAGATPVDSLERLVPVRDVVREQLAWSRPFWRPIPRDVFSDDRVATLCDRLDLDPDPRTPVQDLPVSERFALRIMLALLARENASALVVDDIDQLRSLELRDRMIARLRPLSGDLPVVVSTVNPVEPDTDDRYVPLLPELTEVA